MKREEHYCDICGTKITWQDADGDTNVQAIRVPEIHANVHIRTSYGSSGQRVGFSGLEFCGWECFDKSLSAFSQRLHHVTKEMVKL